MQLTQQSDVIERDIPIFANTSTGATAAVDDLHHKPFKKNYQEPRASPQKHSGLNKQTNQKICKSKNQNLHHQEAVIDMVHLSIG